MHGGPLCFCPHPRVGLKGYARGKWLQRMGSVGDGAAAGLPSSPALVALGHRATGGSTPSGCMHTAHSTSTQQTPTGRNCLGQGCGTTGPPGGRRLLRGASRKRRVEIRVEIRPSAQQGMGSAPNQGQTFATCCIALPSRSCIPPAGPSSSTSHGLPSSSPVLPHIPPSPVQLRLPHSLSVPHSGRTTDPVSSAACLPCPHPFSALRGSTHPHPAPGTPPTTALLPEVLAALGRAGEAPWHMAAPEQLGLEEAPHQHGDQEPPVL